jgi:hypothetical protein
MFFEYMRLVNMSGESGPAFSESYPVELITRIVLILLSAVAMVFIGYKIKGVWGATLAIILCALCFLYINGLLPI